MNEEQQNQVWLRQLIRIYVTGLIVTAIALFIWKVVFQYSPWFDLLQNHVLAGVLTVISVVILPLILGSIIRFGVNPVLGKWHKWTELMSLEDRIFGGLENKARAELY